MTKMNKEISFLKMPKRFKTQKFLKLAGFLAVGLTLSACQGQLSDKPPIHLNPNMDDQPRMEAQEENSFFADGRSMRQPVEGTVARGLLKSDVAYYEGIDDAGDFITYNPVDITKSFLYRGKERYEIFCTPCHGNTGAGDGIVIGYGYVPPPSFHAARIIDLPDGEIYSAIHNGVRTMPPYRTQIPVEDRWAIVAYIRALQQSRSVNESELQEYGGDATELQAEFRAEQEEAEALAAQRRTQQEETTEQAPAEDESATDDGTAPEETDTEGGETSGAGESTGATAAEGKQLFAELTCQVCHSTDGSGSIGPTMQGLYNSEGEVITDEGETITVTKDEEYITESILNPDAKKPVEFQYGIMSQIPVETHEVEALIEYIKSLSEN